MVFRDSDSEDEVVVLNKVDDNEEESDVESKKRGFESEVEDSYVEDSTSKHESKSKNNTEVRSGKTEEVNKTDKTESGDKIDAATESKTIGKMNSKMVTSKTRHAKKLKQTTFEYSMEFAVLKKMPKGTKSDPIVAEFLYEL